MKGGDTLPELEYIKAASEVILQPGNVVWSKVSDHTVCWILSINHHVILNQRTFNWIVYNYGDVQAIRENLNAL